MTKSDDRRRPIDHVSVHGVELAIWENENDGRTDYAVTITRNYKTDEGWRDTGSMRFQDLLPLAKAADLAHSEILRRKIAQRQSR